MDKKLLSFIGNYSKLIKIIEISGSPNNKYKITINYSSMYFLIKSVYPDRIEGRINLDFFNQLVYSNYKYHLDKKLILIDSNQNPKIFNAMVFLYEKLHQQ